MFFLSVDQCNAGELSWFAHCVQNIRWLSAHHLVWSKAFPLQATQDEILDNLWDLSSTFLCRAETDWKKCATKLKTNQMDLIKIDQYQMTEFKTWWWFCLILLHKSIAFSPSWSLSYSFLASTGILSSTSGNVIVSPYYITLLASIPTESHRVPLSQMELLASGIWKRSSPHSPPWSVDREGGAANYPHLQVLFPYFDKSRFLLPLLNASLTSNCSSALPRGLIMRGEVHFLDHCSLAETSGTFLKEATYFYLQLTPQQSVSKLSLLSFVFYLQDAMWLLTRRTYNKVSPIWLQLAFSSIS